MYERMKKDVKDGIPSFFVPPRVQVIPASIKATKAQKRGALKALDAIEDLFGKGGKHWVQGNYHTLDQGFDAFCLSGAFNKVDGRHEALARVAISLAIFELYPRAVEEDTGDTPETVTDEVINDGAVHPVAEGSDGLIVQFNDLYDTRWSDVKKVLRRARKLLAV